MSQWLSNTLLPTVIAGAVLLLALWPTERSGQRLLKSWGIPQPHPDQVRMAVRYLRQRRILFLVLFLAAPALSRLIVRDDSDLPALNIVLPLLMAMLIAELVATVRPVSGVRVASLDRREWRDLVPRWAMVAGVVLVVLVVAGAVAGFVAQPWVNRYLAALPPKDGPSFSYDDDYFAEATTSTSWLALGYAVAGLLLVAVLIRLAVRRPSVEDQAVDAALRFRTARVAVGIGLGWLGAAVGLATQRIHYLHSVYVTGPYPDAPASPAWLSTIGGVSQNVGLLAQFGAILCWIFVTNPSRRALAAVRA